MMLGCFISSAWLFQGLLLNQVQNSRAKEFRVWECLGFVFFKVFLGFGIQIRVPACSGNYWHAPNTT